MQRRPTEKWAAVISQRKVYVYLDTTRGLHHRYGVKDVRRRGAGHRVRHARKRRVRRYPDAAVKKERYRGIPFFRVRFCKSGQGGKLTKFTFPIVCGAKTREACPFMVYARLFC